MLTRLSGSCLYALSSASRRAAGALFGEPDCTRRFIEVRPGCVLSAGAWAERRRKPAGPELSCKRRRRRSRFQYPNAAVPRWGEDYRRWVMAPRKRGPGGAPGLPGVLPALRNEPAPPFCESRATAAGLRGGCSCFFASLSAAPGPFCSQSAWPQPQPPWLLALVSGALSGLGTPTSCAGIFSCRSVESNKRIRPRCSSSLLLPRASLCQIPLASRRHPCARSAALCLSWLTIVPGCKTSLD